VAGRQAKGLPFVKRDSSQRQRIGKGTSERSWGKGGEDETGTAGSNQGGTFRRLKKRGKSSWEKGKKKAKARPPKGFMKKKRGHTLYSSKVSPTPAPGKREGRYQRMQAHESYEKQILGERVIPTKKTKPFGRSCKKSVRH